MAWLEDPVRVTRRLLKLRRLLDDPPLLDDGKTRRGASAHVRLRGRDKGLAPGQFAAFYDGEVCLGSGVIVE